ncbi:hypothetical protein PV325_012097 [Microctonus aethiopoides]|nr:hypothetical protein PV325_012097 [Microctonus aethiopoides]
MKELITNIDALPMPEPPKLPGFDLAKDVLVGVERTFGNGFEHVQNIAGNMQDQLQSAARSVPDLGSKLSVGFVPIYLMNNTNIKKTSNTNDVETTTMTEESSEEAAAK